MFFPSAGFLYIPRVRARRAWPGPDQFSLTGTQYSIMLFPALSVSSP